MLMHPNTARLYQAARRILDQDDAGLTEVAEFLGLRNRQTLKNWEERGPSAQGIVNASRLGINPRWVEHGVEPMLTPTAAPAPARMPPTLGERRAAYATTVTIPLLLNHGEMGSGSDALSEDVIVDTLTVSSRWLRKRVQAQPASLRLIHAYGDSMDPTMADGDILLVDTSQRDPAAIDGVYVLRANQRLFIKRVRQRLDGALEVSSDNPAVKTVDALNGGHTLDVVGRVVWVWHGVGI